MYGIVDRFSPTFKKIVVYLSVILTKKPYKPITMNQDFNFCDNAPANFAFCFCTDCATADSCLRGLATRDLTTSRTNVIAVNPLLANKQGGASCCYYCKAEKQRVAYGFKRALAKVPSGEVAYVRDRVCALVCRRDYYYLLKGEKPMFPAMQRKVEAILVRHGLTAPIEFDRYDWRYNW